VRQAPANRQAPHSFLRSSVGSSVRLLLGRSQVRALSQERTTTRWLSSVRSERPVVSRRVHGFESRSHRPGRLAQLARASARLAEGRKFESSSDHPAPVAQRIARPVTNRECAGSTPARGAIRRFTISVLARIANFPPMCSLSPHRPEVRANPGVRSSAGRGCPAAATPRSWR
jgi:hypothetical protein